MGSPRGSQNCLEETVRCSKLCLLDSRATPASSGLQHSLPFPPSSCNGIRNLLARKCGYKAAGDRNCWSTARPLATSLLRHTQHTRHSDWEIAIAVGNIAGDTVESLISLCKWFSTCVQHRSILLHRTHSTIVTVRSLSVSCRKSERSLLTWFPSLPYDPLANSLQLTANSCHLVKTITLKQSISGKYIIYHMQKQAWHTQKLKWTIVHSSYHVTIT